MDDKIPIQNDAEIEALKKTTRISLDEVLSTPPPPKKATTRVVDQSGQKKATGPITGILTHTAPIPQTIRLKRPSTSPIVINPSDITAAPTVVKMAHARGIPPGIDETATVIKKAVTPQPMQETSRIILDVGPQPTDVRRKTSPIQTVSPLEATPAPKTIRLKRPSAIITPDQAGEKQPLSEMQMARKSETAKIELPKETQYQTTPTTQRKTIKIKRTDRNIIPRTLTVSRQAEAKPQVEAPLQSRGEAARDQKEIPALTPPVEDEPLPVFSVLAGLAVISLVFLVYLLTAQAFGPKLILPVPSGLF